VRQGDPTAPDAPTWPAYDLTRRAVKVFDVRDAFEDDPGASERHLWEALAAGR